MLQNDITQEAIVNAIHEITIERPDVMVEDASVYEKQDAVTQEANMERSQEIALEKQDENEKSGVAIPEQESTQYKKSLKVFKSLDRPKSFRGAIGRSVMKEIVETEAAEEISAMVIPKSISRVTTMDSKKNEIESILYSEVIT